ncbi:MAG TPA: PilN domain-containing protein [Rhizomicrobium sp.]|nr:PilN domain-containing protein [Rhizomicrobium sp.]
MLAQNAQDGAHAVRQRMEAGFSWWTGELRDMVPQNIRAFFAAIHGAVEIAVMPSEIIVVRRAGQVTTTLARIMRDALAPQMLAKAVPRETGLLSWLADPVVLRLPLSGVLEREFRLPRTARRDLPNIVRHEIGRQSPVDAASIYYEYRAIPDADGLRIRLRMVRRDDVDAALALCRTAGIDPSAIAFTDDDEPADGGNFPVSPQAARAGLNRMRLVPRLALAAIMLAVLFLAAIFLRGQWILSDLSERVAAAQASAESVERLQRQIAMSERGASLLSQQKRDPAAVQILAEVTRLLPDGAWLYEFELSGGEVRIHGFARSASSLIAVFDASPLFRDAQFRSPLMQGPTGDTERFDMSFKLKPVR